MHRQQAVKPLSQVFESTLAGLSFEMTKVGVQCANREHLTFPETENMTSCQFAMIVALPFRYGTIVTIATQNNCCGQSSTCSQRMALLLRVAEIGHLHNNLN